MNRMSKRTHKPKKPSRDEELRIVVLACIEILKAALERL